MAIGLGSLLYLLKMSRRLSERGIIERYVDWRPVDAATRFVLSGAALQDTLRQVHGNRPPTYDFPRYPTLSLPKIDGVYRQLMLPRE